MVITDLWGACRTGRWGAQTTFLDKVKPWWDRRKAQVLHAVAMISYVGFSVLADR